MAALLLRAGSADRPDLHPARVELFNQALDGTTLARGIPAFERNDAAPPLDPVDLLELQHRELQLVQLLLIAHLVREPALEIELGKPEPGFDFFGRCHVNHSRRTTARCTDFYRYRSIKCLPRLFTLCSFTWAGTRKRRSLMRPWTMAVAIIVLVAAAWWHFPAA